MKGQSCRCIDELSNEQIKRKADFDLLGIRGRGFLHLRSLYDLIEHFKFYSLVSPGHREHFISARTNRERASQSLGRVVLEFELWSSEEQLRGTVQSLLNRAKSYQTTHLVPHFGRFSTALGGVPSSRHPGQETMDYDHDQVNKPMTSVLFKILLWCVHCGLVGSRQQSNVHVWGGRVKIYKILNLPLS